MLLEDKDILDGLKKDNQEVFRVLFEAHYEGLYRFGYKLTGDPEAARELIQEIFLRIWQNRKTISIKGTFKSYLYTAIHNRAVNWIRHEKIRQLHQQEMLADRLLITVPAPEVNPWLPGLILKEISLLPERSGLAFTETQINDRSVRETAQLMGISEKTVEKLLANARRILRKKIKKLTG